MMVGNDDVEDHGYEKSMAKQLATLIDSIILCDKMTFVTQNIFEEIIDYIELMLKKLSFFFSFFFL